MPDAPGSTRLVQGSSGPSAYQLAVQHGFWGTEQAWIDSLKGETGPVGAGLVNRGDWLVGSTYNPNDYVFYNGSFWMVKGTVSFISTLPPSDDPDNWVEMTASGSGGGGTIDVLNDITPLISGQSYVDVTFSTTQSDASWLLIECFVLNETDSTPLNIIGGTMVSKTNTGFRMQLYGVPDTGNYELHWAIISSTGAVTTGSERITTFWDSRVTTSGDIRIVTGAVISRITTFGDDRVTTTGYIRIT